MDAQEQGPVKTAEELSRVTPWSAEQWRGARSWARSDEEWSEWIEVIIAMGGEPRSMAQILASHRGSEAGCLVGVDGLRARRYVQARAVAAAFEQRMAALIELLEEEHWRADQAESALGALNYGEQMPRVWMPGVDEEPPEDVNALIDLNGGRVYARYLNTADWYRPESGKRSMMVYRWPIPDAGPFIALPDDWDFQRITAERERRADEEREIRDLCRHPNYQLLGSLVDLVRNQISYDRDRFLEQKQRADELYRETQWWQEWSNQLTEAIPEGHEARYGANPEGAQEAIIDTVYGAYARHRRNVLALIREHCNTDGLVPVGLLREAIEEPGDE